MSHYTSDLNYHNCVGIYLFKFPTSLEIGVQSKIILKCNMIIIKK